MSSQILVFSFGSLILVSLPLYFVLFFTVPILSLLRCRVVLLSFSTTKIGIILILRKYLSNFF